MAHSMKARLTTPLIRENGGFRNASWEEALGLAAENLRTVKQRYGHEGFGIFSCSKTTNELNFLSQKFARAVMGTNNIDSCNRT